MIDYAWLVPFFPLLGALIAATCGRWLKDQSHWPVVLGIAAAFVVSAGLLGRSGPEVAGEEGLTSAKSSIDDSETAEHHLKKVREETESRTTVVYRWLQLGEPHTVQTPRGELTFYDLDIPIELRVDGLTTMMISMVTFVATLIAIFAAGYMAGDPGYPRFFSLIGLFVFSMTGLVLSSNYVLTYAFWEGVGVCSYLLIGFWHAKPSAAAAAKKAFLVNRIGDVGFAIAIFWMWYASDGHNLSYDNILGETNLRIMGAQTKLGIALLLFWAATAKSAQIPLYVWLPDAMEGPTPVSALIHAATMVTAGVYLIARSAPLVFADPLVPLVVCVIGAATALLSALMALTQNDLKRVLAYSTISQLGYMFMALGAGNGTVKMFAVAAAMFHLFTHAFFKALLFLGSGSVMHAMGGVIDMRRFGGLRHRMPYTHWTFLIGALSLAGIVPFAGFFSKDEILVALRLASESAEITLGEGYGSVYTGVLGVAIFTAFLTAFYTFRAYFLTFWGPEKLPSANDPEAEPEELVHAHGHAAAHSHETDPHRPLSDPPPTHGATDEPVPQDAALGHGHGGHDEHFGHECPPVMWVPLVILAAGVLIVGWFGPLKWFEGLLERTPSWVFLEHLEQPHGFDIMLAALGLLAGVLGIGLAWLMYFRPSTAPAKLSKFAAGRPYAWSYHKFYVDEFYNALVVRPLEILARISGFLDQYLVHGLVQLFAWIPRVVGRDLLAPFQNGLIQFYAGASALGVTVLLLYFLLT